MVRHEARTRMSRGYRLPGPGGYERDESTPGLARYPLDEGWSTTHSSPFDRAALGWAWQPPTTPTGYPRHWPPPMPSQPRRYPAWFGTVATTLLTVAVAAALVFVRAAWFPDLGPTSHSTSTDGSLGSSDDAGSANSAGPANLPAIPPQLD